VRLLSEQLRRFLDDRVWIENRRVFDLLRSIEAKALQIRDLQAPGIEMHLDEPKVPVALPTERPLYRRVRSTLLDPGIVEPGDDDFDTSVLLDQIHIDRDALAQHVLASLGGHRQIALEDVIDREPLEHGLAELIGYLSLREPGLDLIFDDDGRVRIGWTTDERERVADLPRVTFTRNRTGAS